MASGTGVVLGLGIAGLIATFFSWFSNIVNEAQRGDHTPVVQLHLRYGMILFIASEVMFFVGWFWSWFDFALFPLAELCRRDRRAKLRRPRRSKASDRSVRPAAAQHADPAVLGHHGHLGAPFLIHGDREGLKKGLWLTILLGLLFTCIQAYEYAHAPFAFGGNTYGSAFYMATGFHGFHVIVGTIFLTVCLRPHLQGPLHAAPAFRLRSGGLVLALRRRGVAVPVRRRLRLGRLGRRSPLMVGCGPTPSTPRRGSPASREAALFGLCPRCGARTLFDGWTKFADRAAAPAGSTSRASMSATGRRRS